MIDAKQFDEALAAAQENAARDFDALAMARRADVVEWRWSGTNSEPGRPEPWDSERDGHDPYWLDDEPRGAGVRVGLDADGLAVIAESTEGDHTFMRVDEVWLREPGVIDLVNRAGALRMVMDDDRMTALVGIQRGDLVAEEWTWENGAPVRGVGAEPYGHYVHAYKYEAEVTGDGRLAVLRRGDAWEEPPADDTRLVASLAIARDLVADQLVFDARLQRHEPMPADVDAAIAIVVPALERAVVEVVGDTSDLACVHVVSERLIAFPTRPQLPPMLIALRGTAITQEELYDEDAQVPLVDHLDDDALRVCRALAHAYTEAAEDAVGRVARDLAARLNERAWPGARDGFAALVSLSPWREGGFVAAEAAIGPERLRPLRLSLRDATRQAQVDALPGDPRELIDWLQERGADADDAARLAGEARVALRLEETHRDVRSRFGGAGLLPPGEEWPCAYDGRPLTFIAGVDLSELPAAGEPLPTGGWLLFFVDLGVWDEDILGFVDLAENRDGQGARVLWTEPGTEPVAATNPGDPLAERPIEAHAQLSLPDDWDASGRLELRPAAEMAYKDVRQEIMTAGSDHWMLGVLHQGQGDPAPPDSLLLMRLSDDGQTLGEGFMDAGEVQFWISRDAFAARDWSAVTAEASSC